MTPALMNLTCVVVGALIGHRLTIRRKDRDWRANFIGRMCELKSLADKIENDGFAAWAAETQVTIEKECGLVQKAIFCWRRKKFAGLRKRISEIQRSDIADYNNSKLQFPRAVMTYQAGRLLIAELLQDLIDCAD